MKEIVRAFRTGNSPLSTTAIEYSIDENGVITKKTWGMGGQTIETVEFIPEEINGYRRLDEN